MKLNKFSIDNSQIGGRTYHCKPCHNQYSLDYYRRIGKHRDAEMRKIYKLYLAGKLIKTK